MANTTRIPVVAAPFTSHTDIAMSTAETTKQPAVTNGIDGLVRTYKRVRRFILGTRTLSFTYSL